MSNGLTNLVEEYRSQTRVLRRGERIWFKKPSTLRESIHIATNCLIDENGRKHRHQWRLKKVVLQEAEKRLIGIIDKIEVSKDFEKLHSLVSEQFEPINGAGRLYCYDVSLRIGWKLGFEPSLVHLHAGTAIGAKHIGLDHKRAWVLVEELPEELHTLSAFEAEDFLCVMKSKLSKKY